MLNKIMPALAIAMAALLIPSQVYAYGAAHVGYTHVGPNGVQHYGATEVSRPGGTYAYGGAHTTTGYGTAGVYHAGYGATTGGYHYDYHYSGATGVGGANYGYIR